VGGRASCKIRRRKIIRDKEGGKLKSYVSSYLDWSETIIAQGSILSEREISAGGGGATHYVFKIIRIENIRITAIEITLLFHIC
jgi:hypothetical protein